MLFWHHRLVGLIVAQQFSVAVLGHPFGARQMGVVDLAAFFRIEIWVETEQNMHGFAPIGSVPIRVEESQVKRHMLTIIRRELLAFRRFIQKVRCSLPHHQSPYSPFTILLTKCTAVIDP